MKREIRKRAAGVLLAALLLLSCGCGAIGTETEPSTAAMESEVYDSAPETTAPEPAPETLEPEEVEEPAPESPEPEEADSILEPEETTLMERFMRTILPPEAPTSEPAVPQEETAWYLTLVNRDHPLPEDYEIELTVLANGETVDERIYPSLQEMFDTARAEGVYPVVASGYRTWDEQMRIMEEKVAEYTNQGYSREEAETRAREWVAVPGTSEHQLGFSVDINADGINSAGYEVYDWLAEHAWEYGFIRRYPEDKTEITGISNEPWHYRYVGVEAAREITERGLCLEEYLEQLHE